MRQCYKTRGMTVPSDYKSIYEKRSYMGEDEQSRSINGQDLSSRIYKQIGYEH